MRLFVPAFPFGPGKSCPVAARQPVDWAGFRRTRRVLFGLTALTGLLVLAPTASAYIFVGHPVVNIVVDRPEGDIVSSEAYVETVSIEHCDNTSEEHVIDDTVNLVAGLSLTVAAGDLCAVTVAWGSDLELSTASFALEYSESATTVSLNGNPTDSSVSLIPHTTVNGVFSGSAPRLRLTVN